MSEQAEMKLRITLLELQVECLRSVLSEWDADKDCYLQMNKADVVAALLNHIRSY